MRGICNAKVILEWDDGRKSEIGTIGIEPTEKLTELRCKSRIFWQRLGWEFVRKGFRMMLHHRKWVERNG